MQLVTLKMINSQIVAIILFKPIQRSNHQIMITTMTQIMVMVILLVQKEMDQALPICTMIIQQGPNIRNLMLPNKNILVLTKRIVVGMVPARTEVISIIEV